MSIAKRREKEAKDNPLQWSRDIAYLSGLITSDGNLKKDKPYVRLSSGDYTLIEQAREIAEANLNINECTPRQRTNGGWRYQFTSRKFYYFLENMGLMPNKSHKLGKLNVPDNMFVDWFRGEFDGDGSFFLRRGYISSSLTSGSPDLLRWVSQELKDRNIVKGKGNVNDTTTPDCYQLQFYQADSRSIAKTIYKDADYYLQRKYGVVESQIDTL